MRMRLRRTSALVAAAMVIAACSTGSSDTDEPTETSPATEAATDGEADGETEAEPTQAEEEPTEAAPAPVTEYPRDQTVFTSGTQWGPPSSWNPNPGSGFATGVKGLLYEPLFLFNPDTLELEPWLAESGEWTGDLEYTVTLREGLTWSDGEALDAEDVVFTVNLGQVASIPWSNLFTWMDGAEAVDETTIVFTFSEARYQEWDNWLYSHVIVPEHVMGAWSDDDLTANPNENPIGSGPYLYETHSPDRMVWTRNDNWWGTEALGMEMSPTYIVDIVNSSNEVALGLLLQGGMDLSNNFLPGIATLVDGGYGIQTYFPEEPYMLAANTAMLVPNLTKEPTNDAAFRQALAHSIDIDAIVSGVYGNIVSKAHPSGLLPLWEGNYDQAVADEYGFTHDPEAAAQILADAGYEDTDGDGFVETPGGDAIELSLITPAGWTDWNEAARVISEGAAEAGINVVPDFPDAGALDDARTTGDFDLVMNNWAQVSNTPWTYYNYLLNQPIQEQMFSGNFGRYENEEAWELVNELSATPSDDPAFQETMSQLQQISMEDLPMIPMWYNGMWSQANTGVWSNWPTAADDTPDWFPTTWGGYFEMGSIKMFADIELTPTE